ncbi:DUF1467 family protein [Paracoccus sp. Z118]|uniref:DUF1467 family protein n=1 Tax=Paracoccus sp. Z118 TaxID=2851017 RepID=UPI001C2C2728|nr:DUF1467 family protein [Paracoccus sp. Z118]MBV0891682.1 DUF1467 family protein [Paracoccus sp. Z118]
MSITSAVVLFATLWFLCLFLMLPIGHRSQEEMGEVVPGTPAGAPHNPRLGRKMIWATLLAAAIFAVVAFVIFADIITRADMTAFNPLGV